MPPLPSAHLPSGASECPGKSPRTHSHLPLAPPRSRQGLPEDPVQSPFVECWTPTSHAEPGPAKAGSFSLTQLPPITGRQEPLSLGPWGLVGGWAPCQGSQVPLSSAVIPRTIPTPTPRRRDPMTLRAAPIADMALLTHFTEEENQGSERVPRSGVEVGGRQKTLIPHPRITRPQKQ